MSTKNSLTLMVDVTPYEHKGNNYDALNIVVSFKKSVGFHVNYQPVKRTTYGYKTGPMPSSDPLVQGVGFVVNQSSRNNVKKLMAMQCALQIAEEGIKLYFDNREYDKLQALMTDVCNYGYTPAIEQRVADYKAQCEAHENVAATASEESPMMEQYRSLKAKHTDALLLFRCGDFYAIYEDDAKAAAEVLGLTITHRDGLTMAGFPNNALDTYLPKLIRSGKRVAICDPLEAPKAMPKSEETPTESKQPETTVSINAEPAKVENTDEQVVSMGNDLPEVKFATYTTKKGATAPQIIGFVGEDDPRWKRLYDEKPKWVSASWYKDVNGNKCYRLIFGVRYMDVAKALTEAYNTGDREAWQQAEQACKSVYEQAQADGKARWEAKKQEWADKRAEREAKNTQTAIAEQPNVKTYTEQEVAALMQRVMAGDKEAMEQVNAIMQKVA